MTAAKKTLAALALLAAFAGTAEAQYGYGRGYGYQGGYRAPVCQDIAKKVFVYGYGFVVKTTRVCQ